MLHFDLYYLADLDRNAIVINLFIISLTPAYLAKSRFALPLTSAVILLKLLSACNAFDILAAVKRHYERHYEWWDKLAYWSVGSRGWNILPYTILETSHEKNQRGHENVLKFPGKALRKQDMIIPLEP